MSSRKDNTPPVEDCRGAEGGSVQITDTDHLMHDALNRTYAEPEPPAELYDTLAQLLQFFEEIASEIDTESNSE